MRVLVQFKPNGPLFPYAMPGSWDLGTRVLCPDPHGRGKAIAGTIAVVNADGTENGLPGVIRPLAPGEVWHG